MSHQKKSGNSGPVGTRRFAHGPEIVEGGVSFRIWAPKRTRVELVIDGRPEPIPLRREEDGYWSVVVGSATAGTRYRYRLDGEGPDLPDIAARYLPEGPHAAAEVVDHRTFTWTDDAWVGPELARAVMYELHIGTFSPEGNWAGAIAKLPALKELGVTVIEVMPVAEFSGDFGWGYDGVAWYAPTRLYGKPDDFRAFVDRAHALGMGVILDVVYNHMGAVGDYSAQFCPYYVGQTPTEWGNGLNYDGEHCEGVRALAVENAVYWIQDFHLDGLRLDAIQAITDHSAEHLVTALARATRAAAGKRRLLLVGENEPQDARLLRQHTEPGVGSGLDALWNDDFHHTAIVTLTGRRQGYFSDYLGQSREWLAAARHGFLFQGQRSAWQKQGRGHSTRGLAMNAFISFLENHDQVANSLWGARVWQQSSPAHHRAMTTLLLLGPWTTLLFQGQEWNSSAPFLFFAQHEEPLAGQVAQGRATFLAQFPGCATPEAQKMLRIPAEPATFQDSHLHWDEREQPLHARALRLHTDLLRLRREDPTLG
ncbi:MAG TPA: malto-oligosyltrehalose trehalohydrolase, partial [Polyangia bacterium]|nr:malto-oligosyltrehalose trehalohydrolase [Polyangia bacterium]